MNKAPFAAPARKRSSRSGDTSPQSTSSSSPFQLRPLGDSLPASTISTASTTTASSPQLTPIRHNSRRSYSQETSSTTHISESNGQYRLLLAIDYGTTFTGIGYAYSDCDYPDIKDIKVIKNFGNQMDNDEKIPSKISYSPCSIAGEEQFGADISPEGIAMVNTKLELDHQETKSEELDLIIQVLEGMNDLDFKHVKAAKGYPGYTWKGPEDVVTDYLEKVFHAFEKATRHLDDVKLNNPVDILITVPVRWSYKAKNSTLRAIRAAGFNDDTFPLLRRYMFVTEPEAAAIYTAHYMKQQEAETLKIRESFILCDAGGGTVDVCGYKVKRLDPLELEMITVPTGAKCGASFINRNFQVWLARVLGERNYSVLDPRTEGQRISGHAMEGPKMRQLMESFEIHKKAFHSLSMDVKLDLPAPLDKLNRPGYVEAGELTISHADMCSFFDPCVDEVIYLVQGQMTQIEAKRTRVKSVFLVGGFSESPYLHEQLQKSLAMRRLMLRRPETSWSAVIRGAVLSGMEKSSRLDQMTVKMCARSFGITIKEAFSRRLHDNRDVYTNALTGRVQARGQMLWLAKKGDLVFSQEPHTVEQTLHWNFPEGGERLVSLPIFEYPDDDLPDRYETAHEELTQVEVLKANLSTLPRTEFQSLLNENTGLRYYRIDLVCRAVVRGTTMSAELWAGDNMLVKKDIENIDKSAGDDDDAYFTS